jgi:hypothetical protein
MQKTTQSKNNIKNFQIQHYYLYSRIINLNLFLCCRIVNAHRVKAFTSLSLNLLQTYGNSSKLVKTRFIFLRSKIFWDNLR